VRIAILDTAVVNQLLTSLASALLKSHKLMAVRNWSYPHPIYKLLIYIEIDELSKLGLTYWVDVVWASPAPHLPQA